MPGELIALIEEVLLKQNGLDFTWQTNKEEKAEVLKLNSIACSLPLPFPCHFLSL